MNNDKKIPNVPNLRFPEFTGEWIKYRVSDLLEFFPTNSLSWDQLRYDIGDLYNLHYGIIHKGASTQIDTDSLQLPSIRDEFTPKTYTLCKDGDVVFADASEDTNDVAKVVEFYNCGEMNIVSGLHTIHGRDKLNLTVKGFKGYIFSSAPFRRQIKQLAQGAKVYSVSPKNFNECFAGVPSKEEQVKVANLLCLLDDRIATQSQIIKELETLIIGAANSLFDDTRYSFEKLPLSALCLIKKGEQINGLRLSAGGAYYVMNGGIVPSGYHTDYNTEEDTISISEGGNSCGYVQYNSSRFWSGGHCYTLNDVNAKVSNKYLYYYLKNQEKRIMELRVGSGLPNIQKKELDRFEVRYPSPKKQHGIVRILDSLADKIETERNLLSAYQKQKKYLLSQMFI